MHATGGDRGPTGDNATPTALFAPPRIERRALPGGGWLVRSLEPLAPHAPRITDWLWHWAAQAPHRPFLRERAPDGAWRGVSFGEAADQVRRIAAAMRARGLGPMRPVAVLSGNSVRHALIGLAAQAIGVPFTAVSPPYSLMSADLGKLRHILRRLRPRLIYVEQAAPFARALAVEEAARAEVVVGEGGGGTSFDSLLGDAAPGAALEAAIAAVDPDAPVKILFTSGSTGVPKGVLGTHRMMAANQQQMAQVWPFLLREPPVILDWLPWSHVFGASHNLNMMLRFGGTLWIDEGKPVPGPPHERTLANLREVAATIRFDVPRGYALLLPHLESDAALRERFFERLRLMFCAGAALPEAAWTRLSAIAAAHAPRKVPMVSSWGLTETAPAVTTAHMPDPPTGCIGVPLPGAELKLVPVEGKTEIRVRGPMVFPGYLDEPEANDAAFDEEGFLRTGDAATWVDESDPNLGLRFDGRLVEDFKLATGTRVNAAELRERLARMNAASGAAASRRVARALVLAEPPSLDAGETTDKGSLNVRAILACRAADLARLYDDACPEVIRPD